jgi:glycosyltransferase involved in cell wall biosynthesis
MEQTQLLMNNPELRSTMGKAGRERVLSLFTLEKTVQETENLLASL